jgi:16S rRNA (guanine527-N7)-methyltransferase
MAVDCLDAVAKKAAFIRQVAAELQLPNLKGLHGRVQDAERRYDVVACRAFASLADFVAWSDPALAEQGVWLAMKGKSPTAEIEALPKTVEVFHVEQLKVPALNAERCIVWMKRRAVP